MDDAGKHRSKQLQTKALFQAISLGFLLKGNRNSIALLYTLRTKKRRYET